MGDIGGEMLDGVHACHSASVISRSAPERSPISSPRRVKSGIRLAPLAVADAVRRLGEAMHGPGDRACQIEREQHGDGEGDAEDLQDVEADVAHRDIDGNRRRPRA